MKIHKKRASGTDKNLQTSKSSKHAQFVKKKTIKQSAKPLQKIRQTFEYIYKSKMQTNKQINQHTIAQCGCDHTIQNAEMKQAKKLQHSFCN